jgi:hypothetical protein
MVDEIPGVFVEAVPYELVYSNSYNVNSWFQQEYVQYCSQ